MRFLPKRMRRALAATATLAIGGGLAAARRRPGARARRPVGTAPQRDATAAQPMRPAPAGDSPPGFWYGTDSLPVTVSGSAPYQEPRTGGNYGGYIGMTGSWAYWLGCRGGFLA